MDRTATTIDRTGEKGAVMRRDGLDALIAALHGEGYEVIGPRPRDGAIAYEPVDSTADLPVGRADEQDGGHYRLVDGPAGALFATTVGPHTWKRYLYPPRQTLWSAKRTGSGFAVMPEDAAPPRYAFLGVRPCELRAMQVQDRVFGVTDFPGRDTRTPQFTDTGYARKRAGTFVIAVNCGRAGGTCFCVSMDGGPKADGGFDLAVTELPGEDGYTYLVEAGSERGAELLDTLPARPAEAADMAAAQAVTDAAAVQMGREMVADAPRLLADNLEHPRWEEVAKRCLSCANCTMVCPTCFCSTMEDVTDLTGAETRRERRWDSCFTIDFSYIHGGSIRQSTASRYRQWITHKLSTWHEQFGTSGCTGCGRCITWCPVGIDITEEARAIRDDVAASANEGGR
ncbi:4Fe-4S dicluster domain-containing protein [Azospirillum sp.]|uniref:4Fe-4S dicluster domain-containing protein n=1 Tax=Azospirillum sp. TaxID=34012 RepID=UPI002D32B4AC|nr:4Fe-4S dicluster domain-containing protein [Azospirillum sp.]HYD65843.1 4Fe-4S dicluster domain-containing protein [Azospirillum sp.]